MYLSPLKCQQVKIPSSEFKLERVYSVPDMGLALTEVLEAQLQALNVKAFKHKHMLL